MQGIMLFHFAGRLLQRDQPREPRQSTVSSRAVGFWDCSVWEDGIGQRLSAAPAFERNCPTGADHAAGPFLKAFRIGVAIFGLLALHPKGKKPR